MLWISMELHSGEITAQAQATQSGWLKPQHIPLFSVKQARASSRWGKMLRELFFFLHPSMVAIS